MLLLSERIINVIVLLQNIEGYAIQYAELNWIINVPVRYGQGWGEDDSRLSSETQRRTVFERSNSGAEMFSIQSTG